MNCSEGTAEPRNVHHQHEEQELRIVLVGKTGGGRSATGNTLLGDKRFESELSSKPLTQTCSRAERAATWKGKRVTVIDTPALFDARVPEPWGSREIQKCFDLSRPGPHALVFVVQAGRSTEEDRVAAERVEQAFGQGAARYMAVLFTRKEDIDVQSLEDYVKQSGNKALQDLVRKCQNRCCAFNNKATGDDMNIQAEELLSKIEKMVQENRDKPHLKELLWSTVAGQPEQVREKGPGGCWEMVPREMGRSEEGAGESSAMPEHAATSAELPRSANGSGAPGDARSSTGMSRSLIQQCSSFQDGQRQHSCVCMEGFLRTELQRLEKELKQHIEETMRTYYNRLIADLTSVGHHFHDK